MEQELDGTPEGGELWEESPVVRRQGDEQIIRIFEPDRRNEIMFTMFVSSAPFLLFAFKYRAHIHCN